MRSRGKGVESRRSRANADWGKSWSESNLRGEPLIETAKPTAVHALQAVVFAKFGQVSIPLSPIPLSKPFIKGGGGGVTRELGQRNSGLIHSWLALALQTESRPTSTSPLRQMFIRGSSGRRACRSRCPTLGNRCGLGGKETGAFGSGGQTFAIRCGVPPQAG